MKITQIIQGVHNPSAGPTYSVARLADELCNLGEAASVLTLGQPPAEWPHKAPFKIHGGKLELKTGISISLMQEIRNLSKEPGIFHGHGIWRVANLFPLIINKNSPARIVLSPRGMLSPWSMQHKSLIKQPFWQLLQKPALQRVDCFHVTAPLEYDDIRRVGLKTPASIIPNGVDIPELPEKIQKLKKIVFLSRIDPKKGLDILLPAWTAIANKFEDWELVIAGPLDGEYPKTVQAMAEELGTPRVKFIGQILGEEKRNLLASASLFVLPTYSENFGIAVAEALAHGTPVITTTETPWTDVKQKNCGWCIPPDEDKLKETLTEALNQPLQKLQEMGDHGRVWMQQDYAWPRIAEMMKQTYAWLQHNSSKPDWIVD